MDTRKPEDTNTIEVAKKTHLPARYREISALAKRLRLLLAAADAGNHVPFREVSEVKDLFDTKKLDPPERRRVMDLEWHDMFKVVVSRLEKVLRVGAHTGPLEFQFFEGPDGDIETRWMGDGEVLAGARGLLRVAETLVSDYCSSDYCSSDKGGSGAADSPSSALERHAKVEIKAEGFPFDMRGWCEEKTERMVEDLAAIVDLLRRPDLPSDFVKEVRGQLWSALWNATKVLSLIVGAEWSPADRDLVAEGGVDGFKALAVKYDLRMSDELLSRSAFTQIQRALAPLLKAEHPANRTRIHAVILEAKQSSITKPHSKLLEKLAEMIERVTQGQDSWDEFVRLARIRLDADEFDKAEESLDK